LIPRYKGEEAETTARVKAAWFFCPYQNSEKESHYFSIDDMKNKESKR